MTAKDGTPCAKCGGQNWNRQGQCAPCMRIYWREWQRKNKIKVRERNLKWYYANAEKQKEAFRIYGQENKEQIKSYQRTWKRKNADKVVASAHRRRTRKTGAGGSYTDAEFRELCAQYDNRCLGCGRKDVQLTADHVVPVSKGGTSDISNIQPLCQSCNRATRQRHAVSRIMYRMNDESRRKMLTLAVV